MAPEMVSDKIYDEKIDMWGAGTVMCYMLTGTIPENGMTKDDPSI
jgi:serine/threonine protein kinase